MDCKKSENIKNNCNCTYSGCPRKGVCYDCIKYHLRNRQLPACCFDKESEKTFDRSFEYFAKLVNNNKI